MSDDGKVISQWSFEKISCHITLSFVHGEYMESCQLSNETERG